MPTNRSRHTLFVIHGKISYCEMRGRRFSRRYSCLWVTPVAGVVEICRRFGWISHHPNCRPPDYTVYHSSLLHLRYHTACNGKLFYLRTNLLVYWVREVKGGQTWGHGTCDRPHRYRTRSGKLSFASVLTTKHRKVSKLSRLHNFQEES